MHTNNIVWVVLRIKLCFRKQMPCALFNAVAVCFELKVEAIVYGCFPLNCKKKSLLWQYFKHKPNPVRKQAEVFVTLDFVS